MLTWDGFDALGLDAVVTTRHGGVSVGAYESLNLGLHVGDDPAAVIENRRRAAAAVGAGLDDLVFADQVHRRDSTEVTSADAGRGAHELASAVSATDILVTRAAGLTLVIQVADCAPLVLFDPVARVLACAHAGWQGTVEGVAEAAVAHMLGLGADAERILVGIGPAIGAERYQVGAEVIEAAGRLDPDLGQVARPDGTGRWLFDLVGANRLLLLRAGVPAHRIDATAATTGPPGPFFSHRSVQPCGRFALLARIRP